MRKLLLLALAATPTVWADTTISTTAPTNPITVSTLYSGQQLLEGCNQNMTLCKGYISGVIDTTETYTVNATQKHWCTSMQGTDAEISAVVIKYLTDHPDKLAQSAQSLVTTALTQAYCPQK